jgi:hypothetical protein
VAFSLVPAKNQCWVFSGLADLGGVMNDPTGTTTCFGFLGFFASLFPRTWPFAMVILLAAATEVSGWACPASAIPTRSDHRPLRENRVALFDFKCPE